MRNNQLKVILPLFLSVFMLSCDKMSPITIRESFHYSALGNPEVLDQFDCIIYDSVLFSDGSYLIHQTKDTPQNGLTRYFDKKGRLIATNSFASETPSQVLVYAYDEEERLTHLLRFNAQDQEDDFHDLPEYDYLPFRLAIEDIDFKHPDTTRHSLTSIIYDDHGNVKEAIETPSGKTLVAPEGYKLNVRVDPCTAFWESDLDGGQFFLKMDIVPISKPAKEYYIKRFVDFIPTFEEYYNNGQCDKIVRHPNPSYSNDKKETKIRLSGNNKNTYVSEIEGDDHSKVDIWENGRLLETHWESKYGTIIKRFLYSYPSPDKMTERQETYDYKARKLKPVSTKTYDISEIPTEAEEMDLLRNSFWTDVYDKRFHCYAFQDQ